METERAHHNGTAIPPMDLEEAMRTQRAIRRLKPDRVSDALILHLIELALKAPTGGNRQNCEFIVVRDRRVKGRLALLNRIAWSVYRPVWRWAAFDDPKTLRLIRAVHWQARHYEEIPVLIVACLRWSLYGPLPSGVRLPLPPFLTNIFYGSIFPAVQNLLLAARVAGLGASLTVMPLWSTFLARRVLRLPPWVTPVAVIPVGWPRGRYGSTTRVPAEEVVHVDEYGNRPFSPEALKTARPPRTTSAAEPGPRRGRVRRMPPRPANASTMRSERRRSHAGPLADHLS
jgi:nitroreductase